MQSFRLFFSTWSIYPHKRETFFIFTFLCFLGHPNNVCINMLFQCKIYVIICRFAYIVCNDLLDCVQCVYQSVELQTICVIICCVVYNMCNNVSPMIVSGVLPRMVAPVL